MYNKKEKCQKENEKIRKEKKMGLFHQRDPYKGYNIYSMKKYVDRKRILVTTILILVLILTFSFLFYQIGDTIIRLQTAKKYINQVTQYQKEQEEKQVQIAEEQRIRKERLPHLTEQGKENIKNIYHSDQKRVFLTFDDGPSQNTETILNILKEQNIKATFFVLGSRVEVKPEITKKIFEEGHFIANHGYSHSYSSIYSSPEEVLREYQHCNDVVSKAIGEADYQSHLFRFPGGYVGGKYAKIKQQANQILEQNEIMHVDWNAVTGDAEKQNPNAEYLINNLQRTTQGKNSVVILMHDAAAKTMTAEILPQVIQYLREQGYEFKSFYDILT